VAHATKYILFVDNGLNGIMAVLTYICLNGESSYFCSPDVSTVLTRLF